MNAGIAHLTIAAAMLTAPVAAWPQVAPPDTTRADSVVTLPAIAVTVTRSDRRLEQVPYAVTVLERDDIRRGRVTAGLDEALAAYPGVIVANRYNQSLDQRVSIRGFGARSAFGVRGIKILLDGIPQTLPDGQGQLTNIDLADTDRIEILRGSSSSLYGNASGGVISVWTSRNRPATLEPTARLVVGSYGFFKWAAGATLPVAVSGSVSVTASRTTSDGYRTHSAADQRRAAIKLVQPLDDRTTIQVMVQVADSPTLDNPGALTADQLAIDPAQADPRNVSADAGKAVTQGLWGISLERRVGLATATATVFGLRRDLENPLSFAYIELDRWAYGFRATTSVPIPHGPWRPVITAGIDAQWQRDDRRNFTPDRASLTLDQFERVGEVGPFAQATVTPAPGATLTVGARYDRVTFRASDRFLADGSDDSGERVMSSMSATAGFTYAAHPVVQPYASVGTGFETPTTTELVNRPDGGGGFNPGVDPQRATNFEVGVRGDVFQTVRYSLAAFYSDVRDQLIPFEVAGTPNRQFFRNAGSARHAGAELELALRLGGFAVQAAYTYSDHRFTEFRTASDTLDGNALPGIPRHYAHVSLRYRSSIGIWAAMDNTYSSSYYADDRNTGRNDWWTVTGIRAGWESTASRWRLAPFVGVLNAFDRRYVSSVVVNAFGGRYFEPAPPRNVYVGLSVGAAR